jgi:hypothetical protein
MIQLNHRILLAAVVACVSSGVFTHDFTVAPNLLAATPASTVAVVAGSIDVEFEAGKLDLPHAEILDWIARAACAVQTYYGRFPVLRLKLIIVPVPVRRGVIHGVTFGDNGATIRMYVGQLSSQSDLRDDWKMTHEMVHLAFPSVLREHHWIEEGIATYVEPIARCETGDLPVRTVWLDLVNGLPNGLPGPSDKGLDHTPTWGRTYWGGAMFCMLADVEIRRRTQNRYGLQRALQAIVEMGGNIEVEWPLTQVLQIADEVVGVPALMELYEQMKSDPVKVDLPTLWTELGVEPRSVGINFSDRAPLASLRQSITALPKGLPPRCASTKINEIPALK